MYEEFYSLQEKPFNLLPDADFLYMSAGHDNAYTHLRYAIQENKGFVVITGEIGCGKTTLINYFLRQLPKDLLVGVISHTDINPELFFKLICRKFELNHEGLDKGEMISVFQDFMIASRQENRRVTLIIDEAQNLPDKTIEEIRMLSNLEAEKEHLVQIILIGQPELRQKLRQPHLQQFLQRVTIHYHLEKLNQNEVKEYIRHRLHVAGCPAYATLFSDKATDKIWEASQGIPRLINYTCDMALVHGYADGLTTIDEKIIDTVIKSRDESTLFNNYQNQEFSTQSAAPTPEPLPHPGLTSPDISNLIHRISVLEEMLHSINTQLNEQFENLKARDKLTLEIFLALQESLKSRQKIALRYQKINSIYQKMNNAVKKHLAFQDEQPDPSNKQQ
ncbi:MAG: AAA family ATPase [Deltaproteobacteria bacterium]|nr:AAA family ATPase [Candidatus Tharpella aukensis]